MKKIQRDLKREFNFARVEHTGGGHLRLVLPNGRAVYTASTPSCSRTLANLRRDVRKELRGSR